MGGKFDATKLRMNLKLALTRLRLQKQKKTNGIINMKRDVAAELRAQNEETARIKAEQVIKDDFAVEAYDILEIYLEEVSTKIKVVEASRVVPPELSEALCTLVYAAPRVQVPEFAVIREQLGKKFGKPLIDMAMDNVGGCVNARVMHKLSILTPEPFLVYQYLNEIAQANGVPWHHDSVGDSPSAATTAAGIPALPSPPMPSGGFGGTGGSGGGGGGFGALPQPLAFPSVPSMSSRPVAASALPGAVPAFPQPPQRSMPQTASAFPQQQQQMLPPAASDPFPQPPRQPNAQQRGAPFPVPPAQARQRSPSPTRGQSPSDVYTPLAAFPAVPGGGGAPLPAFPSVPGGPARSPRAQQQPPSDTYTPLAAFPTVPGGGAPLPAFPSVPGGGGAPLPAFPSVPGGGGGAADTYTPLAPFPSVPGGGSPVPDFPSVPGGAPARAQQQQQPSDTYTPLASFPSAPGGMPDFPSVPAADARGGSPIPAFPSVPGAPQDAGGDDMPDFDELSARFEALKKRH